MALSRAEVQHIALLARLELSEAETTAMAEQLGRILEHFERLGALDTTGVPPTEHVGAQITPLRDDVVSNTPDPEAGLANAPQRDGRFFKVPKIIE